MKVKNSELEKFGKFLMSLELRGKDSRMRTRFVKLLDKQLEEVRVEYKLLLDEYCNKDEDGQFKKVTENGKEYFDVPEIETFNNEYNELMNEELIIEETESNSVMLTAVRDIVLSCERSFSGKEAIEYDQYCDIVENFVVN